MDMKKWLIFHNRIFTLKAYSINQNIKKLKGRFDIPTYT